ncbi:ankyrin repeat and MYND domain-containing protein 1-like [Antedon mediterranea]|uniref:ankyrin repeat and MYND domain-containing protein 1-like n=1 Tax=Antedon mediterranea TaxID=105859 RepID=UPI003AF751B1
MSLEFMFAHLKSATRQENLISGDSFSGSYQNKTKSGVGIFLWPSGDKYEGEYLHNERQGRGRQDWSDGSYYKGDFLKDTRHGNGYHEWANGEIYEGSYYKDYRHGYGIYIWPENMKFEGMFYMDKKEGYGTFFFSNGNVFKGLYKEDEREGPGILTYPNGKEDIGLWKGEQLIKLTSEIKSDFTIQSHCKFDYSTSEYTAIGSQEFIHGNKSKTNLFTDGSELINDQQTVHTFQAKSVDMHTLQYDKDEYDKEFFGVFQNIDQCSKTVIPFNYTPSFLEMQKHILKHKKQEPTFLCQISDILNGRRGNNSCKGQLEVASEKLICSAASGNYESLTSLLSNNQVNVNVTDKNGQSALISAAVNMHGHIINYLLDKGADVNQLSDEGISALAACHMLFYPIELFQYNIVEQYMQKSKEGRKFERILNHSSDSVSSSNCVSDVYSYQNVKKENRDVETEQDKICEENNLLDENALGADLSKFDINFEKAIDTELNLFGSNKSITDYSIEVSDNLLERVATAMSGNPKIVAERTSQFSKTIDCARRLAISKADHSLMESTIHLLLRRGADPNASNVPMPVLFFAVKAADVTAVQLLLQKGASTETCLSVMKESLTPLHIACAISGNAGVEITKYLLEAGADSNARTNDNSLNQDEMILNTFCELNGEADLLKELNHLRMIEKGRTPLHIVCSRDDNNKLSKDIVRLLLLHGANPDVLCRGQSPLSLAISYGNDQAVDELLSFSADPSLPLGQGIGSALCVASNTEYEFRRSPQDRINLVSKLLKAGANILAPVAVGPKNLIGTAVDYAHFTFNQDRRIAHMPYHALNHTERDTYNARQRLLSYLGNSLREASGFKEKQGKKYCHLCDYYVLYLVHNSNHDQDDFYVAKSNTEKVYFKKQCVCCCVAGKSDVIKWFRKNNSTDTTLIDVSDYILNNLNDGKATAAIFLDLKKAFDTVDNELLVNKLKCYGVSTNPSRCLGSDIQHMKEKVEHSCEDNTKALTRQVMFNSVIKDNDGHEHLLVDRDEDEIIRKPLFKHCYECGRSLGIRLSACSRCKKVFYCSKACKFKAWNMRHKEECVKIGGHSRSPSPSNKVLSGLVGPSGVKAIYSARKLTRQCDSIEGQMNFEKNVIDKRLVYPLVVVVHHDRIMQDCVQAYWKLCCKEFIMRL